MRKLIFTTTVILFSFSVFGQMRSKVFNVTTYGGSDGAIHMDVAGGTPPYSYNWNTGSQEENLDNLTSGIYTCSVTDNGGCTYSFSFRVTEPGLRGIPPSAGNETPNTSTASRFTSSIQVYPNPSEGALHVNFSSTPNTAVSLKVMDINGRVVIENNVGNRSGQYSNQLDLSQQPKGIYFVQVKTDKEIVNQKIIIQ